MEEEVQRPVEIHPKALDGNPLELPPEVEHAKPAQKKYDAPPREIDLPSQQTGERRLEPLNLLELPVVNERTAYAVVTHDALRAHGQRLEYVVPDGFRGFAISDEGEEAMVLPGEKVSGHFHLHLLRDGTMNLKLPVGGLTCADGYQVEAKVRYSVKLPAMRTEGIKEFVLSNGEGRSELSSAVLKHRFDHEIRRSIATWVADQSVEELLKEPDRASLEAHVLRDLTRIQQDSTVDVLGIDAVSFESRDFRAATEKEAKEVRKVEDEKKRIELEKVIAREETGAELSREELTEVLDAVRRKRELKELEHEKEKLERERAINHLHEEYHREKHNLEAAMRKLLNENEMEIDRIKFDEYLRMTAEVRDRLKEDRIEFYIQQIQDERLKAELLKRLIERDMSPEQLRELAEIEKARSQRLASLGISTDSVSGIMAAPETGATTMGDATLQQAIAPEKEVSQASEALKPISQQGPAPVEAPQPGLAPLQSQQRENAPAHPAPAESPLQAQAEAQTEAKPNEKLPLIDTVHAAIEKINANTSQPQATSQAGLQKMLIAAGRTIYESDLHGSGRATEAAPWLTMADQPLGSLRSLRIETINGQSMLLAGARRGLYTIDVDTRRVTTYPLEAAFNPLTGVNAVAAFQGKYYATHSQFGLLRWSIPGANHPASQLLPESTESARSVRSLFIDDDYWPTFACGRSLIAIEHGPDVRVVAQYTGAPAEITLAASMGTRFFAACSDGNVVFWEKDKPDRCQPFTRVQEGISGCTLSPDGKHFVIASRIYSLRVLNLETRVIARYDAPQPMLMGREFGSHLFGITRDRSTLYLWESFGNGHPVTEVPLPEPGYDVCGA